MCQVRGMLKDYSFLGILHSICACFRLVGVRGLIFQHALTFVLCVFQAGGCSRTAGGHADAAERFHAAVDVLARGESQPLAAWQQERLQCQGRALQYVYVVAFILCCCFLSL